MRGTVRGGGAPLSDARVTLADAAGNVVATTRTGLDGAYASSDLDPGAYTLIATGHPPRVASLAVPGTGVDDHDIELAHAGEEARAGWAAGLTAPAPSAVPGPHPVGRSRPPPHRPLKARSAGCRSEPPRQPVEQVPLVLTGPGHMAVRS
ncbi:hypothetical protein GCM10010228_43680 [Streptomyces massasporeus]|nr:hypothetical protein GCM10010228_43680 [Streptomyces massasporeus]